MGRRKKDPVPEPLYPVEFEPYAEKVTKAERERLLKLVRERASTAVPQQTKDYLQGFEEGAAFIAELLCIDLKEALEAVKQEPAKVANGF